MAFRDIRKWIVKKDVNFWPSILLMIFSGAVASEAYNLSLGNIHTPGPGFIIFGTSCLMGLLSLHLFFKSLLAREGEGEKIEDVWSGKHWRQVALILMALVIYVFFLSPLGYLLATFFFLIFLFWIIKEDTKGGWIMISGIAALASWITYIVFSRWFALQFPKGLIRFF